MNTIAIMILLSLLMVTTRIIILRNREIGFLKIRDLQDRIVIIEGKPFRVWHAKEGFKLSGPMTIQSVMNFEKTIIMKMDDVDLNSYSIEVPLSKVDYVFSNRMMIIKDGADVLWKK